MAVNVELDYQMMKALIEVVKQAQEKTDEVISFVGLADRDTKSASFQGVAGTAYASMCDNLYTQVTAYADILEKIAPELESALSTIQSGDESAANRFAK